MTHTHTVESVQLLGKRGWKKPKQAALHNIFSVVCFVKRKDFVFIKV